VTLGGKRENARERERERARELVDGIGLRLRLSKLY